MVQFVNCISLKLDFACLRVLGHRNTFKSIHMAAMYFYNDGAFTEQRILASGLCLISTEPQAASQVCPMHSNLRTRKASSYQALRKWLSRPGKCTCIVSAVMAHLSQGGLSQSVLPNVPVLHMTMSGTGCQQASQGAGTLPSLGNSKSVAMSSCLLCFDASLVFVSG